jgi:hypothetical protein
VLNLSIERNQFGRLAGRLVRETKHTTRNVWLEIARQFTKDCIKLTPPFGGRPAKESFKTQRDIGMAAIKGDLFGGTRGSQGKTKRIGIFSGMPAPMLQHLDKLNDGETTVKWTNKDGQAYGAERTLFRPNATKAEMREHHKRYFRNGRMSSAGTKDRKIGRWQWIDKMIVPEAAAKFYLKWMQGRVGHAKSGWTAAVRGLGVKGIPQWITRMGGAGVFKKSGVGKWPTFTIGNRIGWIQAKGRELGIIKQAFKFRIHAMKKQLAMTLRKNRRR